MSGDGDELTDQVASLDLAEREAEKTRKSPRIRKPQLTPGQVVTSAFDETFATQDQGGYGVLNELRSTLPASYILYGSLMLLPTRSFTSHLWPTTIVSSPDVWDNFLSTLAEKARVSHIAVNAPIPPSTGSKVCKIVIDPPLTLRQAVESIDPACTRTDSSVAGSENVPNSKSNILRSPTALLPFYGNFGPGLLPTHVPAQADLDAAYWTSTVQNGIKQVWAPRYTMFSAGNIKEKARLLELSSLTQAVEEGRSDGRGCAVVDLYVGIGYFALSYLSAGVDVVLGWDLNPWSIEGLRRGTAENTWSCEVVPSLLEGPERDGRIEGLGRIVAGETEAKMEMGDERRTKMLAFCEDNGRAGEVVGRLEGKIPPVRHVNCGLLPSSQGSWRTAVEVLDAERGGWIHVHENFLLTEIKAKAEDVRKDIEGLVRENAKWSQGTTVAVAEIFRVKSYAPGVYHCVVDVHISPGGDATV